MRPSRPISQEAMTRFLNDLRRGDADADATLMPQVYRELRAIASALLGRDRPARALNPTELVNEAFLRLYDPESLDINERGHFFAIAARAMRQLLVDDARAARRLKRGGDARQQRLDEVVSIAAGVDIAVLDLDEALSELAGLSQRQARVVEMRFFGGLDMDEIAKVFDVSKPTIEREWYAARAWLGRKLGLGNR